jgi:hypothetical protein
VLRRSHDGGITQEPGKDCKQPLSTIPDDLKLTQLRAEYSTQSPDFVRNINTAKDDEEKKEYGTALAWYLKAQSVYPMSDLSKEGIARVVKVAPA